MPADRITSLSPWHLTLILDDSDAMAGEPVATINEAVRAMIDEMRLISGGHKPYFRVTLIRFGSTAEILCEAESEHRIDLDQVTSLRGDSGRRNCAEALRLAHEVLERNPGAPTDFQPFVFFFCGGLPDAAAGAGDARAEALETAQRLRELWLPSGRLTIIVLGLGARAEEDFLSRLASERGDRRYYRKLESAREIYDFLPDIGTVASGETADAADAVIERVLGDSGAAPPEALEPANGEQIVELVAAIEKQVEALQNQVSVLARTVGNPAACSEGRSGRAPSRSDDKASADNVAKAILEI